MTNAPSSPISLPEVDLPALTVRLMTPADGPAIRKLDERAFGPGRYTRTAYRLREGVAPDYALSCVANIGSMLIGANVMTPISIGDTSALLLGPLTVEPAFRSRGIGEALAQHSLTLARQAGHQLVVLVGDEPYYAKFGFKRSPQGRLQMPGPVDPARVLYCELQAGAFEGISGSVTRVS